MSWAATSIICAAIFFAFSTMRPAQTWTADPPTIIERELKVPVAGLDLPRVALHDVDVRNRHLQDIGGDLRQRGRMPVTLAHRTRIQCRAAARIDRDACALPAAAIEAVRGEPARRGHAARLGVSSDANAAMPPSRAQMLLLFAPVSVVECRDGLVETALVITAVIDRRPAAI